MKQERMGVEGKGVLRSLQNDSLPLVDLFIREAIQNSLDATMTESKATIVDVGIKSFDSKELAKHLEGLTNTLEKRYGGADTKALYVSDKNTYGLTGSVRDKQGNIYNLIYTIQKNQEQAGAGGSWGLGKTSYFRLGNGIVLYYSRIMLSDGSYEERLAGSLIEDSTKDDRLLDNDRGIAWWGDKDKNSADDYDASYPLTEPKQIQQILDVFDIKPYKDSETGTIIIIPFIEEDKLLPKYDDENKAVRWWESNLESAIEVAIQKWYAPRILNPLFEGAYLIPSIGGSILSPDKFQPFFKIFYDLYIQGLKKKSKGIINVDPIKLSRRGLSSDDGTVGWASYGLFNKSSLKMLPPDNEVHPLEYFGFSDVSDLENTNAKIVAYARKPGMIVEYDINGEWTKDVQKFENSFLLSFFVPNSDGILYEPYIEKDIKTLEDYLRKTEKSDHAKWEDIPLNNTKITIVERIKRNNSKLINEKFNGLQEDIEHSKTSALGKKIGGLLLPKNGIAGKMAIKPMSEDSDSNSGLPGNKRRVSIDIAGVESAKQNELSVLFNLYIAESVSADVSVNLRIGNKNYDEADWKKDMGEESEYPFLIKNIFIDRINEDSVGLYVDQLASDTCSIQFSSFGNLSMFRVNNNQKSSNLVVQGKIYIEIKDNLIQPSLIVSEVK